MKVKCKEFQFAEHTRGYICSYHGKLERMKKHLGMG